MIYHYTSIEVLFKILDQVYVDKSNPDDWNLFVTLRATHASFLNDLSEGQLLPNVLKKIGVDLSNLYVADLLKGYPYVISFSKNADSLSMWRTYGREGSGVAIGFDEFELHNIKNVHGTEFFSNNDCDCIYLNETHLSELIQQEELWKKYSENPQNLIPLEKLLHSSLKYKHKAFASEEEYRLYTYEFFDEQFYVKDTTIIPYQEVRVPTEALKEIVLGPMIDKERLSFSIRRLLGKASNNIPKYHNLDSVGIKSSKIPYISK